jgi:hypothetical protein
MVVPSPAASELPSAAEASSRGHAAGSRIPETGAARNVPLVGDMTVSPEAFATLPTTAALSHWLQVIEADYREMPCLSLTKQQMRRLWGLESFVCDLLVDTLVEARVLRRRVDGAYVAVRAGR